MAILCQRCGSQATQAVTIKNPIDHQKSGILGNLCGNCYLKSDSYKILESKLFPNAEINEQKQSVESDYAAKREKYIQERTAWIKAHPGEELPINADSYYGIK